MAVEASRIVGDVVVRIPEKIDARVANEMNRALLGEDGQPMLLHYYLAPDPS